MQNTQEFKNLVDLLESPNKENVVLGLQIAQNYEKEFLAYFGCNVQEMRDLVDFLVENKAWEDGVSLFKRGRIQFINTNFLEFPISICILQNLKILGLGDNYIQHIPKEIGKLKKLQGLTLYQNEIQNLPIEIGELKKLEVLNLHRNQLQSIPAEIGKLKKMNFLYLSNNQVQTIPQEIKNLTKLEKLDLSNNKIPTEEIENLRKMLPNCCIIA